MVLNAKRYKRPIVPKPAALSYMVKLDLACTSIHESALSQETPEPRYPIAVSIEKGQFLPS